MFLGCGEFWLFNGTVMAGIDIFELKIHVTTI
jgi:hypothetical protein